MTATAAELLEGLDPEQRLVATTFGVPVVVIAGAGTGKTRALTHRIAYGVASGSYTAQAVLAVTFTTRAAGELRSRLRGLGVPTVQARTFHSAALRQAQYFWPRAYGSQLPPVSQDRLAMVGEAARRLRLSVDASTLRDLLTEISWAKVTNVAAADYAELAERAGREVAGLGPAEVGQVLGRYEQVKANRGVIDFDDILLCTVGLLSEHAGIADEIRNTYRHLLVDEYQDVNPLQQTLLDLWLGGRLDQCVVGDPAQTIHSFAGATPRFLLELPKRHRDAAVVRLVRDYRSSPQVVAVANQLAARTNLGAVKLESQTPAGPPPRVLACLDEADEAAAVVRWLVEQHEAGVPWREQAVLYRVHAQSPIFEAALAQAGVPFQVRGSEGFYERGEVRQVIGQLTERARRNPSEPTLVGCEEVLLRAGWSQQAPSGQGRVRERWESLAAVLALAQDLLADGAAELSQFVAELTARAQAEHPLSADGVSLSTLHSAKGLEWTSVALVGVQEGTLPLSLAAQGEQLAEEARLCYVGLTRARRGLLITWSRTRRGGGARQPSRFLEGINSTPTPAPLRSGKRERRRTALTATCRICGKAVHTGAERKLRRHESCPSDYDPELYQRLLDWRAALAQERAVPGFVIFTDATLLAIAESLPANQADLLAIPGVGRVKADTYGEAVLAILEGPSN